ncbi:integrase [Saccharopolyspora hattusasensis]|uniref:integrase n=1 Tax=Saccharopolyspora hattusasensis TaxID=1128679 RepID=UPI003D99B396
MPRPHRTVMTSCTDCLAWGLVVNRRCSACSRFAQQHAIGRCAGCSRRLPVRKQYCRLCWSQARIEAAAAPLSVTAESCLPNLPCHQLFFAHMNPRCGRDKKLRRVRAHGRIGRPRKPAPPPAGRPRLVGAQLPLFALARDFTSFTREHTNLANPWLAWARHVAHRHGEARGWVARVRGDVDDALIILLSDHAEGQKVSYSEMFPALRARGLSTERTVEILQMLELFVDDRPAPFEDWLGRKLDGLAPGIRREAERWARTLHNGGPRSSARAASTVWNYVNRIRTILVDWSRRYDHLREVTRDDILVALKGLHGEQRRTTLIALRSLFAHAKKTKAIFRNPTSRIKVGQQEAGVLQPLRPEHLKQTTRAAVTPATRVLVALAGVHAARVGAILVIQLDDLDLGNRRLTIAGRSRPLDDLTYQVLLDWLRYRRERWPNTANPHLIINKHTALETKPATGAWASELLNKQTATLERLRIDRQLEEALTHGPDPLHLAVVFGLDSKTAIRYANSARQLLTAEIECDTSG